MTIIDRGWRWEKERKTNQSSILFVGLGLGLGVGEWSIDGGLFLPAPPYLLLSPS